MAHQVLYNMKLVTGILSFIWILPLTLSEGIHVTCLYSEECVLPCQSFLHDIIYWNKQDKTVHSFYHKKDQLDYQSPEYKGRTSLFSQSEINKGNASLILKQIRIQDEGKYRCYAASDKINDEKYVAVSVVAPVKSVDITLKKDTVTCSTSGVYPEPTVLWSSELAAKEPMNNYSNQTDEKLFVVTSELKGNINDSYTYNCLITNKKDNSRLYTATLKQQEISVTDEITLPCPFTKDNNFILTFSTNVLRYNSQTSDQQISDEWKDKVSFSPEDGTVKLYNLNKEHSGTYTCKTTTTDITSTEHTVSGNEDTFKCPVTKDHNYNITLNFDTTVLSYYSQNSTKLISDQWKNRIIFPSEDTGVVKLIGLNNKEHSGTYTCMSFTTQNKYIIHTVATLTGVIAHTNLGIPLFILFISLILSFVIIFCIRRRLPCWRSRETVNNERTHKDTEEQHKTVEKLLLSSNTSKYHLKNQWNNSILIWR